MRQRQVAGQASGAASPPSQRSGPALPGAEGDPAAAHPPVKSSSMKRGAPDRLCSLKALARLVGSATPVGALVADARSRRLLLPATRCACACAGGGGSALPSGIASAASLRHENRALLVVKLYPKSRPGLLNVATVDATPAAAPDTAPCWLRSSASAASLQRVAGRVAVCAAWS